MTYQTVSQALAKWANKYLSKLPQDERLIAASYIPEWDKLSENERLTRMKAIDRQHDTKACIKLDRVRRAQGQAQRDPKEIADFDIGWYDETLSAAQWFGMESVSPNEAAMLLCQLNPLKDAGALLTSNEQTGPDDFKLLLRAFEDVMQADIKQRTLNQWLDIANDKGLKYHSWIKKYAQAVQSYAPVEPAAPAAKKRVAPDTSPSGDDKPWLIADSNDPAPDYHWYTPARYFARQLVKDDSTLLVKKEMLADKTATSLAGVGIFKRGKIQNKFSKGTVLKSFVNVALS